MADKPAIRSITGRIGIVRLGTRHTAPAAGQRIEVVCTVVVADMITFVTADRTCKPFATHLTVCRIGAAGQAILPAAIDAIVQDALAIFFVIPGVADEIAHIAAGGGNAYRRGVVRCRARLA